MKCQFPSFCLFEDPRIPKQSFKKIRIEQNTRKFQRLFQSGIHALQGQKILVSGTSSNYDMILMYKDPNHILGSGFPQSVGGKKSAVAIGLPIGAEIQLKNLDYEPFWHGYCDKYSGVERKCGIWGRPLEDLKGNKIVIQFYVAKENGPLLLFGQQIVLPIYLLEVRETLTHFHVLMSQKYKFKCHLAKQWAFLEKPGDWDALVAENHASW